MKRKLVLTILSGLVIGSGSLPPARAQSYDTLANNKSAASSKLSASYAKRRFDKIVDNGFQVRYQIRGKTITASAVGNKRSYLRSKKVKLDDGSVVVKAMTKDRALEITTHYLLDEKEQKLTIDQKIRNMSAQTVNVRMMGQYVDPKQVFGIQGHHTKDLVRQAALKWIRAGQLVNDAPIWEEFPEHLQLGWEAICHCIPPPPPCPGICEPERDYIPARLYLLTRDKIVLQWNQFTILAPQEALANATLPKEVRSVTQFYLDRGPARF